MNVQLAIPADPDAICAEIRRRVAKAFTAPAPTAYRSAEQEAARHAMAVSMQASIKLARDAGEGDMANLMAYLLKGSDLTIELAQSNHEDTLSDLEDTAMDLGTCCESVINGWGVSDRGHPHDDIVSGLKRVEQGHIGALFDKLKTTKLSHSAKKVMRKLGEFERNEAAQ